jgi:prepilin signal peptidase PulO-like enzyme (type II secretory pathway)
MSASFVTSIEHLGDALIPDGAIGFWWMPFVVLLALLIAAVIDAKKGVIPDPLIFAGLLIVTLLQGLSADWEFAAQHLRLAIAVGIGLWGVNAAWRQAFKGDAFGMGDVKWTMLVVDCFGLAPALFAWGLGAFLSVLVIGGMSMARRKIKQLYFGPYLFVGLLAGLYWLRLRSP